MNYVKPKKHLGQHFLHDKDICQQIANSLTFYDDYKDLIEIGPGTGALTEFLVHHKNVNLHLMDIVRSSQHEVFFVLHLTQIELEQQLHAQV